jgi:hypothetical protein
MMANIHVHGVSVYHMSLCKKKKRCNFPLNSIDISDLNIIFINIWAYKQEIVMVSLISINIKSWSPCFSLL